MVLSSYCTCTNVSMALTTSIFKEKYLPGHEGNALILNVDNNLSKYKVSPFQNAVLLILSAVLYTYETLHHRLR
jgi:hypothetical protein